MVGRLESAHAQERFVEGGRRRSRAIGDFRADDHSEMVAVPLGDVPVRSNGVSSRERAAGGTGRVPTGTLG
jgi:hypothetical protein|eukprot:CAMPEP_0198680220 /NCGR_PEP_ID=MMETSP1468-20131203/4288_1 /TAXON_ID=1461545 /ORGANISM="Mantoniella sp, Strain CCMP1436" /LENGTH=70 /DNA_ID=CAMNT_0044420079 /DNA_START=66 /DNA_END=274 /DNA_ORIENTATION=+